MLCVAAVPMMPTRVDALHASSALQRVRTQRMRSVAEVAAQYFRAPDADGAARQYGGPVGGVLFVKFYDSGH
jgi:hypothetical protein